MMNHVLIRRMALSLAAASFSTLFAVILGVSASHIDHERIKPADMLSNSTFCPILVEGTDLTVEQIAIYDGTFFEDGSGRDVLNTMAILVKNRSDHMILFSHIDLELDCGNYTFEATMLPPYSSVLIPEKTAQHYVSGKIIKCTGRTTKAPEMQARPITLSNIDKTSVRLDNLSAFEISDIKIYYKNYLESEDMYVGGIAHICDVSSIPSGGYAEVLLSCYCSGYSKIIYVQ